MHLYTCARMHWWLCSRASVAALLPCAQCMLGGSFPSAASLHGPLLACSIARRALPALHCFVVLHPGIKVEGRPAWSLLQGP